MATPIGHYLFGLSITQTFARDEHEKRQAFWLAAVACLPDLDIIPGLMVGKLNQFHHGASHSFFAAALFAVVGVWGFRRWGGKISGRVLLLLFLLYASHVLLDYVTLDTGAPFGVPLFWPWSYETYQSAWLLLPNVQHTRAPIVSIHNALLMLQEVMIFLPLLGLIQALKISSWHPLPLPAWFYGGWFLVATWASILLLQGSLPFHSFP